MQALASAADRSSDPLLGHRKRADYNAAERSFSFVLQARLQDLLQGKRDELEILRTYPREPHRLGVIPTPAGLPRKQLRLPVVQRLAWDAVRFMRAEPNAIGGPISQAVGADGSIVEVQTFATRYPHIVIERTDRFADGEADPVEITWVARRMQNQRRQVQVNRLLDAANLALEVLRLAR